MKVNGVVITSSPAPIPEAINARSNASEPDAQPMACFAPSIAGNFFLEEANFIPENEMLALHHAGHRGHHFILNRGELRFQIQKLKTAGCIRGLLNFSRMLRRHFGTWSD